MGAGMSCDRHAMKTYNRSSPLPPQFGVAKSYSSRKGRSVRLARSPRKRALTFAAASCPKT